MEKFNAGIEKVMSDSSTDTSPHLRETATRWACYSLEKYEGDLLTKALMMSKSIVDFVAEYEMPWRK